MSGERGTLVLGKLKRLGQQLLDTHEHIIARPLDGIRNRRYVTGRGQVSSFIGRGPRQTTVARRGVTRIFRCRYNSIVTDHGVMRTNRGCTLRRCAQASTRRRSTARLRLAVLTYRTDQQCQDALDKLDMLFPSQHKQRLVEPCTQPGELSGVCRSDSSEAPGRWPQGGQSHGPKVAYQVAAATRVFTL